VIQSFITDTTHPNYYEMTASDCKQPRLQRQTSPADGEEYDDADSSERPVKVVGYVKVCLCTQAHRQIEIQTFIRAKAG